MSDQIHPHHQTHVHLHDSITELFTDYLKNNPGARMMSTTMHQLLTWSSKQVDHSPDHAEAEFVIRRGE